MKLLPPYSIESAGRWMLVQGAVIGTGLIAIGDALESNDAPRGLLSFAIGYGLLNVSNVIYPSVEIINAVYLPSISEAEPQPTL